MKDSQLQRLMNSRPWAQGVVIVTPISFPVSGWLSDLVKLHDAYVDASRQSLWEDRHRLHLFSELRTKSQYASRLSNARKKRQAKAVRAWMEVLEKVLEGMKAGHCDLDILLDPYFQPMIPTRQLTVWYPIVTTEDPQLDLLRALHTADDTALWRVLYRKNIKEHPAFQVPRLSGKFHPTKCLAS
ncbi:hypothetical protein DD238_002758 [Peronospora effusa]|uniref:Uncharacterized protein n=1 Tax=Peronospora effusa TaxID=542832 RepID=A0A3M6VFP3_9STRA|nr:hypothetical protein DD238_002758 [Peronospora effusa]